MSRIDDAWNKVIDKAALYRFVVDMAIVRSCIGSRASGAPCSIWQSRSR
jgi:hypothetical protein